MVFKAFRRSLPVEELVEANANDGSIKDESISNTESIFMRDRRVFILFIPKNCDALV
eukprot:CAMPEP_0178827940 /NCGR_PEP_ID=MMETSP0746-20121128/7557_1 /TAXON_ID=913974 /ORGANISM="Nitzschia punctata, Strain CCMP561" /LENGTH=56 /DNA_ID=CAMNT_0020489873 /DNA_START=37 /DNA_END=207 /DNA_ORIENTATION=-